MLNSRGYDMKIDKSKRSMFKSVAVGGACSMGLFMLGTQTALARVIDTGDNASKKVYSCGKMGSVDLRKYYKQ